MDIRAKIVGGLISLGSLILVGAATSTPSTPTKENVSTPPAQTALEEEKPAIETKDLPVTTDILYEIVRQNDSTRDKGTETVTQKGVNGTKTTIYSVTYSDGIETSRVEKSSSVTKEPVNEIIKVGTKTQAATQPVPSAPNGIYENSQGNTVPSPYQSPTVPAGASAQCRDGSYSFSQSRSGTCSHHGGVAQWL